MTISKKKFAATAMALMMIAGGGVGLAPEWTDTASSGVTVVEAATSINISGATITFSQPTRTYTGKQIRPYLTVKYNGKTLKANTDYTYSYSNNINPGTATIIVKGKGKYSGSIKKTFKIVPQTFCQNISGKNVGGSIVITNLNCTAPTKWNGYVTIKLNGVTYKGTIYISAKKDNNIYRYYYNATAFVNNHSINGNQYRNGQVTLIGTTISNTLTSPKTNIKSTSNDTYVLKGQKDNKGIKAVYEAFVNGIRISGTSAG